MRNTFSYQFYCRESKASKKAPHHAPVELGFSVNGKRVFINLPYKCSPKDFNRKKRPQVIEDYLNTQRTVISRVLTDMADKGIPLTASNLRMYFREGGVRSYTAGDLFEEYLSILRQRVPSTLTKGVYRKYELVRDLFFESFDKEQECTAITNSVIRKFFALLDDRYQSATAAGYKQKTKSFILFGIDNHRILVNPFQGIKINKERKDITYLTENEISLLINTPIENESLSRVRDAAVFQVSSGLSYADVCQLHEGDLKQDNGVYYIAKNRVKSGTPFCAPVFKEGVEVYNRYGGHIPLISNQKYNVYLHQLESLCGIKTPLHSHLFRHTYCTRLLNKNVGIKTISRAAGHANSKVTEYFYAHLEDKTVIKEIGAVIS